MAQLNQAYQVIFPDMQGYARPEAQHRIVEHRDWAKQNTNRLELRSHTSLCDRAWWPRAFHSLDWGPVGKLVTTFASTY